MIVTGGNSQGQSPVLALPGRKNVRRPGHPASEAGQAQGPAPTVRIIAVLVQHTPFFKFVPPSTGSGASPSAPAGLTDPAGTEEHTESVRRVGRIANEAHRQTPPVSELLVT